MRKAAEAVVYSDCWIDDNKEESLSKARKIRGMPMFMATSTRMASSRWLLVAGGALSLGLACQGWTAAQSRGSTTTGMFGNQQLGSPSGASPSGMGTGMTTGMGGNNNSSALSNSGATAGTNMG